MPYATYRFNKIIAAETIRFIVTVAIVVYKGLKLVVYRMLTPFVFSVKKDNLIMTKIHFKEYNKNCFFYENIAAENCMVNTDRKP